MTVSKTIAAGLTEAQKRVVIKTEGAHRPGLGWLKTNMLTMVRLQKLSVVRIKVTCYRDYYFELTPLGVAVKMELENDRV